MNNDNETIEVLLSDNTANFHKLADAIIRETNAKIKDKLHHHDQTYLDLIIEGELFTLHRENYLGVSITSKSKKTRQVFEAIKKINF